MLVVVAGVYGGVTAHKAMNGAASGPELAVATIWVVGIIAVAGLIALMTSYTAAC